MKRTIKLLLAPLVLTLLLVTSAQADPLFFSNTVALQDDGATRVDLFANPGVVLTGNRLDFLVDITGILPAGTTDTLNIVFTEEGQAPQVLNFRIPLFDFVPPPYTQLFSFSLQNTALTIRNVSLRVDILNSNPDFIIPSGPQGGARVDSFTYNFRVAQPIPEPASIVLGLLGTAGFLARRKRRS